MSFDYNEFENEMIRQSIVEGDRLASVVYGCTRNNVNCENCDASVICNDYKPHNETNDQLESPWHTYPDERPPKYGNYIVMCDDSDVFECRWDSDMFDTFGVIAWKEMTNDLDKQLTEQQLFDSAQNVMFEWMSTMFANCLDAYGAKQYTKDTKLCESCIRKKVCVLSDEAFVTECKFYKETQ